MSKVGAVKKRRAYPRGVVVIALVGNDISLASAAGIPVKSGTVFVLRIRWVNELAIVLRSAVSRVQAARSIFLIIWRITAAANNQTTVNTPTSSMAVKAEPCEV